MWVSSIWGTTAVSPFVSEILETQEISLLCRGIFSDQASNPLWYSRITRYTVIIHQVLLDDVINTVLSDLIAVPRIGSNTVVPASRQHRTPGPEMTGPFKEWKIRLGCKSEGNCFIISAVTDQYFASALFDFLQFAGCRKIRACHENRKAEIFRMINQHSPCAVSARRGTEKNGVFDCRVLLHCGM